MPRSPWRRIPFASIAAGLMADRSGWIKFATGSLTPATGARTTRFCRTLQRRSSCAPCPLTGKPALRTRFAPDAAASTASRPAFVTTRDPPLLPGRDGREITADLGADGKRNIFARGTGQVLGDLPVRLICRRLLPEIALARGANQFAANEIVDRRWAKRSVALGPLNQLGRRVSVTSSDVRSETIGAMAPASAGKLLSETGNDRLIKNSPGPQSSPRSEGRRDSP